MIMVGLFFVLLLSVALILLNSFAPLAAQISQYELNRRKKSQADDKNLSLQLSRDKHLQNILSLQRVISTILVALIVVVAVAAWGVFIGLLVSVLVALIYPAASRQPRLRYYVQKHYEAFEQRLIAFIDKYPKPMWWLKTAAIAPVPMRLSSKDELNHLVDSSGSLLTQHQKTMISSSIDFDTKLVKDFMVPRSLVDTIKKTEILGPLVLDSLHKTGHSRFPVINEDIDHVVGTLFLKDILVVDTKRKHTATAETAMHKHVYYIHDEQSLAHALSAFLSTHHHLFIVVNKFHETVGIITLEDTLEVLVGRKINDEFDAHDDLRQVVARSTAHKPNSKNETEV